MEALLRAAENRNGGILSTDIRFVEHILAVI